MSPNEYRLNIQINSEEQLQLYLKVEKLRTTVYHFTCRCLELPLFQICALHQSPELKTNPHNGNGSLWYCQRVKVTNISYTWEIQNFSSIMGETTSSVFNSPEWSNTKWKLAISKIGIIVIIKLQLVCSDHSTVKFKFKTGIVNAENEPILATMGGPTFCKASPKDVFIFTQSMEVEDLHQNSRPMIVKDTIKVLCDITMVMDIMDLQSNDDMTSLTECPLFEDMGKLLQSGKFSDVILAVAGKELKAHKNILSLRSEVFAAMFDYEQLQENTSNRVVIDDMDYDIVSELLTYIYTNKCPNIEEMAFDLIFAADKYALKNLKIMCESVLHRNMNLDTAISVLILADRHNSQMLKLKTIHFIKANIIQIMKTSSWQIVISDYALAHLVEEIRNYNGCI
uniref:BTB domain-containing protein n=1 Tax=Stomoxys calcitrans TaxID=35570 RepID=A0A1I8P3T8_STOCA